MSSERRHPLKDILYLQDRMNRVFDESVRDSGVYRAPGQWIPHVDIFEDDVSLTVKAELPGVKKDDVILDVSDGVLTLSGKKQFSHEDQAESYHMIERQYGSFRRSFNIPDAVDVSKVDAKLKDGVLMINLPKHRRSRTKKIPVVEK
ncbi:MAG TPA: Hsp20/alpha crystallin family protein [Deltaproteobacteria bacterium]|nr:Hsp20/alpha crystallin family protein [Deltaproteobacteria bacterium]